MPTTRPRHIITETELVARALDDAARRWPADRDHRSRLLLRLVEAGHRAVRETQNQETAQRREAIEATSGALTGAFGADYLERLRDDWPE